MPDSVGIEGEKVEYLFDLAFQDQATQSVLIKMDTSLKKDTVNPLIKNHMEHLGQWQKVFMQL